MGPPSIKNSSSLLTPKLSYTTCKGALTWHNVTLSTPLSINSIPVQCFQLRWWVECPETHSVCCGFTTQRTKRAKAVKMSHPNVLRKEWVKREGLVSAVAKRSIIGKTRLAKPEAIVDSALTLVSSECVYASSDWWLPGVDASVDQLGSVVCLNGAGAAGRRASRTTTPVTNPTIDFFSALDETAENNPFFV